MEYFITLRTKIGFCENTIIVLKNKRRNIRGRNNHHYPHTVPILIQKKMSIERLGLPENSVGRRGKESSVGESLTRFQLSYSDCKYVHTWRTWNFLAKFIGKLRLPDNCVGPRCKEGPLGKIPANFHSYLHITDWSTFLAFMQTFASLITWLW